MKQKSSQMRFAPWPVVQAALALALSGLLLARPQAAAQGFAAGLKLCGGSLLPALFPLFVVCGLLGPLAPALGWPLRPLMRLCGIRSPRAPVVLVLGWCGGYAVCAQQIAALRKTGELPPRDAALLLLLGCCSGPGFVVGCIGGQLFGSVALGLLLAARVLHFMFLQGLLHLCLPLVPGQAAVFTSLAPQVVVMKRTAWDTVLAIAFFLCAALYQLYKTCQSSYNNTIPAAHRSRADGPR